MGQAAEHQFQTFDGSSLFYRAWGPNGAAKINQGGKCIILFHRGHEHSARLAHLVDELNLPDFNFFAWDQRGHGRSPGERGYAPHIFDFVRDVESFVRHIQTEYGISQENMVVLAHSVSAVLIGTWVKQYAPRIRAMILATPALQVKLYVPLALPSLRVYGALCRVFGLKQPFIKSYVQGKMLTHDTTMATSYDTDPLVSKQIAVNILVGLYDLARQLINDAGAIVTPTLILSARADWVVKNKPQRELFSRLSSQFKRIRVFKDYFHAILHEKDRGIVMNEIREFIEEAFKLEVNRKGLLQADKQGYSDEVYRWTSAGLPMISAKRLMYCGLRAAMQSIGKLSAGVKLGWETGFDSGQSLDYVYRNQPEGSFGIGKIIDYSYLESPGWRGIRQRKINIEKLLTRAIDSASSTNKPTRIVDIAGGPAKYVLDAVKSRAPGSVSVLIRDWSEEGLKVGQRHATEMRLKDVQYLRGDAFSPESLREIGAGVDILIVSGLYELFPDNQMLSRSLQGIAEVVRPGGYLLYTNQPWHPQLEFIAEVLINRDKKPWIMRCRTQAEMDELVSHVGFEKLAMESDHDGIFTVSLAQRK